MNENQLYFALGIVATILIELFVMPRLKKWQNDLPGINRQKKRRELESDLGYIEELQGDNSKLLSTAVFNVLIVLLFFSASLASFVFSVFLLVLNSQYSILQHLDKRVDYSSAYVFISNALVVLGIIFLFIGVNISVKAMNTYNKIRQIDAFRKQTSERIKELVQ